MNLSEHLARLTADSTAILSVPGAKPELSLMGPFDRFLSAALKDLVAVPLTVAQQTNADTVGIPDFRIQRGGELLGWIELKAVTGKDLNTLAGHDKKQKERFVAGLHNVILTTGWDWELYQDGKRVKRVRLDPELSTQDLLTVPTEGEVESLERLLGMFAGFTAAPYTSAAEAVYALASRARALKLALIDLGQGNAGSHLNQLRKDFAGLLYRNGQPFTWERFVDSYVQIAAFGALLWRLESDKEIGMDQQVGLKTGLHPLLAQCLGILWSPQSQVSTLRPLLEELCRTINLIPPALFTAPPTSTAKRKYVADPIVHAYEPFFRHYDRAAGEANGVYYTPVEIVQHIVSGVDDLLRDSLDRPDGILDDQARFLDPATGTGTFLLGLANEIAFEAGKIGLPTDQVVHEVLTERTAAFELFPGPYTIAHQRLEALLASLGTPATSRLPIYLADTLASPESGALPTSGFGVVGQEIVEERVRADFLKTEEDILVILGNPPYERVSSSTGWDPFAAALMEQVKDASPLESRKDLKSTKDLFVAFWAWALWALQPPAARAADAQAPRIRPNDNNGIAAFITNRTWILGPSLIGLRRLVRRGAKEVWVCDLGGDARGGSGAKDFAGGDQNVFGIQTGVAIVWIVFDKDFDGAPDVHYRRLTGTRAAKLGEMELPFERSQFLPVQSVEQFVPIEWPPMLQSAPTLESVFRTPPTTGIQSARDSSKYSPWGTEPESVFAITSPTKATYSRPTLHGSLGAWAQLSSETARRDGWKSAQSVRSGKVTPTPEDLTPSKVRPALYRPFDERYVYDDPAWIDWFREDLHDVAALKTPILISLPRGFGAGPLASHTRLLPEQHAFNGRGGKAVFPLWLPAEGLPDDGVMVHLGRRSNLSDATLEWAFRVFDEDPWQGAYDYILAALSAPKYAETMWRALESEAPRVALCDEAPMCKVIADHGSSLRMAWEMRWQTQGVVWGGRGNGRLGPATHEGGAITFANGRTLSGVSAAAWNFKVSGWRVLPNWFEAREHWQATPTQAARAQKVVAGVTGLIRVTGHLDDVFDFLAYDRVNASPWSTASP